MKEDKRGRRYDAPFKEQAVKLLLSSGKSLHCVAQELGISDQALKDWKQTHLHQGGSAAELELGILSVFLGFLTGIPAIVCGHVARSNIRKSGGTLTGGGMATGGLILGYAFTLLTLFLVAVTAPNLAKAKQSARRHLCAANLKTIDAAKQIWKLENQKTDSAVPADADLFGADKAIKHKPLCPAGGVYTLNAVATPPSCSVHRSSP